MDELRQYLNERYEELTAPIPADSMSPYFVVLLNENGDGDFAVKLHRRDDADIIKRLLETYYCCAINPEHLSLAFSSVVAKEELLFELLKREAEWLDSDPSKAAIAAGKRIGYDVAAVNEAERKKWLEE